MDEGLHAIASGPWVPRFRAKNLGGPNLFKIARSSDAESAAHDHGQDEALNIEAHVHVITLRRSLTRSEHCAGGMKAPGCGSIPAPGKKTKRLSFA